MQPDLFGAPALPGLTFLADAIGAEEEARLAAFLPTLPFAPFEFQGWLGNRRTVSFGWAYDFAHASMARADPIPAALLPVRDVLAGLAGLAPEALPHMLVTEYAPGAGIGWHRDRPVFDTVIGLSLLAPATLRFRRRTESGFLRHNQELPPRSAYVLTGPARYEWEHSIAPMAALRFSITCRTLAGSFQA